MKNQYFGDVNDYQKYGILRILSTIGSLKIGVCWMMTPNDGRSDGELRRYVSVPGRWRGFDLELFDFLCESQKAERSVKLLVESGILYSSRFYDQVVPTVVSDRTNFFLLAASALNGSDLIFFDPDNDIEVKSVGLRSKDAPKYIFWGEVMATISQGQSVLIYQHFPRERRAQFIQKIFANICDRVGRFQTYAISTSNVVYF